MTQLYGVRKLETYRPTQNHFRDHHRLLIRPPTFPHISRNKQAFITTTKLSLSLSIALTTPLRLTQRLDRPALPAPPQVNDSGGHRPHVVLGGFAGFPVRTALFTSVPGGPVRLRLGSNAPTPDCVLLLVVGGGGVV